MKKFLLLALLASCTNAPAEDPTHKAISALLQKSMNDPASYQPVRWGKPEPWTIKDSLSAEAYLIKSRLHLNGMLIKSDSMQISRFGKLSYAQDLIKSNREKLSSELRERDSLRQSLHAIPSAGDTTRLGYYQTHAFRAKNKLGALVLDSVEFYVDNAGRVKMRG